MIRFVDLNNGAVYNGDAPYIHWFDDEQSINLNYVKKLCVICDDENINIKLNDNNIFSLLDVSKLSEISEENINDFSYKDIEGLKVNNIESKGYAYDTSYKYVYLHMIYILAHCKQEGEYLENLYINDEKFIVGSSFYDKYEPHKINLSNFGVEIPESITRAIYDSNVHEDEIDNILINRKFKELLNEYWNIVANKGSYNSLYNALAWFEYGDLVKIQEFWKNSDKYNQQDIKSYIDVRIKDYLLNHKKSTYIGLYLPLQQLCKDRNGQVRYPSVVEDINSPYSNVDELFTNAVLDRPIESDDTVDKVFSIGIGEVDINDNVEDDSGYFDHSDWTQIELKEYSGFIREENPELMNTCAKWSNEDLSLKMYLLGNFFETYFMPIHLDLIHSTIENVVFANTIKILHENRLSRIDYFNNFFAFKCNVKDGDIFFLDNINTQTGPNTIAGVQWTSDISDYGDVIFGVDKNVDIINNDNELKTFMMQYYNGIGCVVKFDCDVDLQKGDFIKVLNINIINKNSDYHKSFKLLCDSKNIKFNLLYKNEGDYITNLEFVTANGYNYVRTINFSILDNSNRTIKIYKVKYNTENEHTDSSLYPKVQTYMNTQYRGVIKAEIDDDEYDKLINDYVSKRTKFFLPERLYTVEQNKTDGIFLHRTIIAKGKEELKNTPPVGKVTTLYKYNNDGTTKNTIHILPLETPLDYQHGIDRSSLVRDDYVFYPEKHHLEEIATGSNVTLDDYTFTQKDVLMVVPDTKYLKYIEDAEWEFTNISKIKSKPIILNSIRTPLIANTDYKLLSPGFYNIKFRYKLGETIQEISLNSAFRIV